MLVVSLLFGIIVCFVLPIAGLIFLRIRKKGTGKAFLFGMLAFTISQFVIRIPILTLLLPQYAWFTILAMQPWKYGIFLGLTAGVMEEGARWIAIRFFLKDKTNIEHGLAFGLGHGGIEAMVLVGINLVVSLIMIIVGQGDLLPATPFMAFLAGYERLFTIGFHIGASLLVMYGIRVGKEIRYVIAAIILHTVMDAAVVILSAVYNVSSVGIEIYGTVMAVITLALGIYVYCRKDNLM